MVATQAPFFYFLRVLMVRDQNSNSEFFSGVSGGGACQC